MVETDLEILPVILLGNIMLFPGNEMRLDIEKKENDLILDIATLTEYNTVLLVNNDEMDGDLPRMGIVATVIERNTLPNGKMGYVLKALRRTHIKTYQNDDSMEYPLLAILSDEEGNPISREDNKVYVSKLIHELAQYKKTFSFINDTLFLMFRKEKDLNLLTDLIVPRLLLDEERMHEYLITFDVIKRAHMLLEDMYEQQQIYALEHKIDEKVKKEMDQHQKEYVLRERIKMIQEELGEKEFALQEVEKWESILVEKELPEAVLARLKKEMMRYQSLPSMSPELNVIHSYIEWILELPWTTNSKDCRKLKLVKKRLDQTHAGLEKVKMRIIEFLAVRQMSDDYQSPILCLVGPPGVGKTSLAFSIAEAMERAFVKTSVGGVSDESEIMGHRRTYIGSMPGRIIQSLAKTNTNDPVFLIDEIDKMTKGVNGDPSSCFLEILDPEQNRYFKDNYLEESYDLSKVLFILTANDIDEIPEPLKDRLEIITLSGYTEFEKVEIVKKHMLPKLCRSHGLSHKKIRMEEKEIRYIISHYTREAGVRELERQIGTILRKIVTEIVVEEKEQDQYKITQKEMIAYLGKERFEDICSGQNEIGVVNGLAYTYYGGDTLPIEVNYYKGSGTFVLTGCLGDVMKESATIALSYLKSHAEELHIPLQVLEGNDIHIHVPEGAIPKDGPSAGIALLTALFSAFTSTLIDSNMAMTGELTLQGNVLPIGGLKEKSMGASRKGIETILIPFDNLKDLDEVPEEVKNKITYIPVKTYRDVLEYVTGRKKKTNVMNRKK